LNILRFILLNGTDNKVVQL